MALALPVLQGSHLLPVAVEVRVLQPAKEELHGWRWELPFLEMIPVPWVPQTYARVLMPCRVSTLTLIPERTNSSYRPVGCIPGPGYSHLAGFCLYSGAVFPIEPC